jgi:hypothetical protein
MTTVYSDCEHSISVSLYLAFISNVLLITRYTVGILENNIQMKNILCYKISDMDKFKMKFTRLFGQMQDEIDKLKR